MASRNFALYPRHLGAGRFVPSRGGHTDSRENHERRGLQLSRQCCLAVPPPRSPSETPRRPSHLETKSVTLEKTRQQVGTVIQNFLQSNPEYSSFCLLSVCLKIKTRLFTVSSLWFPLRRKHHHQIIWCLDSVWTSKMAGSSFISHRIKKAHWKNSNSLFLLSFLFIYLFFNFSDSSHPIWRLPKIRKSSWALLHPLPWTAYAQSQLIFSYLSVLVCVTSFILCPGFYLPFISSPRWPPLRATQSNPRLVASSTLNGPWPSSALEHIKSVTNQIFQPRWNQFQTWGQRMGNTPVAQFTSPVLGANLSWSIFRDSSDGPMGSTEAVFLISLTDAVSDPPQACSPANKCIWS